MDLITFDRQYTGTIIGVDEAGRGALAGPVVAAAVQIISLEHNPLLGAIKDSKKLSPEQRLKLYEYITHHHYAAVGIASVQEIEEINILEASKLACLRAVANLELIADYVLVDGNMNFATQSESLTTLPEAKWQNIIKGDDKSLSIAAASIIAKVYRDQYMQALGVRYSEYNWHSNKAYGTAEHLAAIKQYGLTFEHRKGWRSIDLLRKSILS